MGSALEEPAATDTARGKPASRKPTPDRDEPVPPGGGRGGARGKPAAKSSMGSALEEPAATDTARRRPASRKPSPEAERDVGLSALYLYSDVSDNE
jgi:hypothetical protein